MIGNRAHLLAMAEDQVARFIPDLTIKERDLVRTLFFDYLRRGHHGTGWTWNGCYYSSLEQTMGFTLYRATGNADFLNWNWDTIVVTERTMFYANRFLAEQIEPGQQVRWLACRTECQHCRVYEGQRFTVVEPGTPRKDPMTQVWVGKWADLSPSGPGPYSAVASCREPVVPLHEHCRCIWTHYVELTEAQQQRLER